MRVYIHEAKTQLSGLLELIERAETVVIASHGKPVAELVRGRREEMPFGIACAEPIATPGDALWQPLTDQEAEDWIEGR